MTSSVVEPVFFTPAAAVTMVVLVAGSWVLMRALRTRASRWLFGLLLGIPAWGFASQFAVTRLQPWLYQTEHPLGQNIMMVLWAPLFGICVLSVAASLTFFIICVHISRSNNSFKPTPLRGAA